MKNYVLLGIYYLLGQDCQQKNAKKKCQHPIIHSG